VHCMQCLFPRGASLGRMLNGFVEDRMTGKAKGTLNGEDLRELFELFSSPTDEELRQVLNPLHTNFYKHENLEGKPTLTQERREFAEDAWRFLVE
jgi:hypothetical protein